MSTRRGLANLKSLAVAHALMGYDIFLVSLLNMCLNWTDETGVYIHLVCLVVYTPVSVSLWLMHGDDESGFTLSQGAKLMAGIILVLIGLGIVLACFLNWRVAHIYAMSVQILSGVYAALSGFFMFALFVRGL